MPCAGFADLIQRGLPVACECDIHGTISSTLLAAAALWQKPTFLADMTIRHPTNDNAELLWHCGPCPSSMAMPGVKPRMEMCLGQFELAHEHVTVCRFGGSHGKYRLFMGEGEGVDGPATNGNYLWLETKNWPEWERHLVKGPYIHHISAYFRISTALSSAMFVFSFAVHGYIGCSASMPRYSHASSRTEA